MLFRNVNNVVSEYTAPQPMHLQCNDYDDESGGMRLEMMVHRQPLIVFKYVRDRGWFLNNYVWKLVNSKLATLEILAHSVHFN